MLHYKPKRHKDANTLKLPDNLAPITGGVACKTMRMIFFFQLKTTEKKAAILGAADSKSSLIKASVSGFKMLEKSRFGGISLWV